MKTSHPLYDIEYVIPHRGAMRLVDALLEWDEARAAVAVRAPGAGIFADANGEVPAWIGIEYMAQAIAAWSGCNARAAGKAPGMGFLLGTRRYAAEVAAFAGAAPLRVEARVELLGDNGLGSFACTISAHGEKIASANISVYQPENAADFIEGKT